MCTRQSRDRRPPRHRRGSTPLRTSCAARRRSHPSSGACLRHRSAETRRSRRRGTCARTSSPAIGPSSKLKRTMFPAIRSVVMAASMVSTGCMARTSRRPGRTRLLVHGVGDAKAVLGRPDGNTSRSARAVKDSGCDGGDLECGEGLRLGRRLLGNARDIDSDGQDSPSSDGPRAAPLSEIEQGVATDRSWRSSPRWRRTCRCSKQSSGYRYVRS